MVVQIHRRSTVHAELVPEIGQGEVAQLVEPERHQEEEREDHPGWVRSSTDPKLLEENARGKADGFFRKASFSHALDLRVSDCLIIEHADDSYG